MLYAIKNLTNGRRPSARVIASAQDAGAGETAVEYAAITRETIWDAGLSALREKTAQEKTAESTAATTKEQNHAALKVAIAASLSDMDAIIANPPATLAGCSARIVQIARNLRRADLMLLGIDAPE